MHDWWWSRRREMAMEELFSWLEDFNDGDVSDWTVTPDWGVSATHKFEGNYGAGGTVNNCYGLINWGKDLVKGRLTIRQQYIAPYPNTQPYIQLLNGASLAYGTYQYRDPNYAYFHEFNALGLLMAQWAAGTYDGGWLKIVIEWDCTTDTAEIWIYDPSDVLLAHYSNRSFSTPQPYINTIKLMLDTTCCAYWDLILVEEL